ncbi:trypsin-like [Condylostylus longicornis]|uniref:trypsin-like n=1 Tax=Condylostylus longicornis TaxID=2530218 RepID=UPI00244DF821|nr:trypsin-like [Condylostylus longicornis]
MSLYVFNIFIKFLLILIILKKLTYADYVISDSDDGQSNDVSTSHHFFGDLGKVLGGDNAKPHVAPYIVSIQEVSSSGKKGLHLCGGVILNENWILTAAHCLTSKSLVQKLIIVAGAHNIDIEESGTQIRKIDYYKNHDLYNGGINPYDIALIYTKEKFIFNSNIKSIELPKSDSMPTGNADLYGWGSISATNTPVFPGILQHVKMPIIDNETCKKALGSQSFKLHKTNLCTGPLTGGTSICQADSGGPLVQNNKIIGIVSWGKTPCGQPNSPSVFVRVSAFIDWIKKIQKQMP